MEKFVLIDGNSLLNRAYYATPVFTTKDGLPTNGVFGFVKLLLKIISDKKPEYLAVAFDLHAPTFRHEMYGDYKAGRKPMPEELVVQVPILKRVKKQQKKIRTNWQMLFVILIWLLLPAVWVAVPVPVRLLLLPS